MFTDSTAWRSGSKDQVDGTVNTAGRRQGARGPSIGCRNLWDGLSMSQWNYICNKNGGKTLGTSEGAPRKEFLFILVSFTATKEDQDARQPGKRGFTDVTLQ